MEPTKIALAIWIHDKPIVGSIIRLDDVREPRKAFAEYKEGDTVVARCRSFKGVHTCILARIRDLAKKNELVEVLKGDAFVSLLQEFNLATTSDPSEQERKDVEDPAPEQPVEIPVPPTLEMEAQQEVEPSVETLHTPKRKRKQGQPPKQGTSLVHIAEDLSLTELEEEQHVSAFKKVSPVKRKCVGSVVRGGLLALDNMTDSSNTESSPVKSKTCQCQCQENIESLQNSCFSLANEVRNLWSWIHFLQQQLQQQQQSSKHERSFSSVLHDEEPSPGPSGMSTPKAHATTPTTSCVLTNNVCADPSPSPVAVYGGFTKEQLLAVVEGVKEYSKACKKLFRRLYTEEEYTGHTLTGAKANKLFASRPALEDPSKLQIIYEIMREKYMVTEVQVREKLRELLKPSRVTTVEK